MTSRVQMDTKVVVISYIWYSLGALPHESREIFSANKAIYFYGLFVVGDLMECCVSRAPTGLLLFGKWGIPAEDEISFLRWFILRLIMMDLKIFFSFFRFIREVLFKLKCFINKCGLGINYNIAIDSVYLSLSISLSVAWFKLFCVRISIIYDNLV